MNDRIEDVQVDTRPRPPTARAAVTTYVSRNPLPLSFGVIDIEFRVSRPL
jgi:hypothetical protein